jgi:DNA primase
VIGDIKKLMLESPQETIVPLLESFGFAHILMRNGSIRFARSEEGGRNISIRLQDNEFLNVHDFVTSAHKDIFSYICAEKSVEFKEVLNKARELLGLDSNWRPPQRKLLFGGIYQNIGKNTQAELKTYNDDILNQYKRHGSLRFLRDGISLETQKFYNISFDIITNRIVFPWRDEHGSIVAIKGRLNEDEIGEYDCKYLYLDPYVANISRCLYNYSESYQYLYGADTLYVGEAEKFCMQLHTMGIRNCVAVGSHSISEYQAKLMLGLNVKNIVLMFDEGLKLEWIKDNADTLRRCAVMRQVNIKWFDYRDCITIGSKDSPSDHGKKIWDEIVRENIKDIKTLDEELEEDEI